MKTSLRNGLLSFSLLSLSPAVLAQTISPTISDLNTIFNPPENIIPTICDIYVNTGNEHAYKACADGIGESRAMAEKYAKNAGKYLGCLDGYYQGVHDGYMSGVNPSAEMLKEASAYVANAKFDSATTRGLERARAEGQTESADQIIARYRQVVGTKDFQGRPVLPNKDYNFPQVTFNGFEDGYEFDILKQASTEFESVYRTGWVNKDSSFEDKIAARRANDLMPNGKIICNQTDTVFFGRTDLPSYISIWDFFRARRQYNFQKYGWRNPDWAWDVFSKDERTLGQLQTWNRLGKLEKTETSTIPVTKSEYVLDPVTQQPIPKKDASGNPIPGQFETKEIITGYRTETKRVPLSASEVTELKNIYISAFKASYDRYYAKVYASQSYYAEALDKYKTSQIIGRAMGQEVATHIARREAYNTQYKLQSAKKYAEEVKNIYKASFDRLISIFENNPVIEMNEAQVLGTVSDGIFRPGEDLRVQFSVTNLGEVSRPSSMQFEPSPDVASSNEGFVFTAPVLDRANYVTNILGRVSDNKEARSVVTIGMAIKNPGDLAEVARPLVVRKQQAITLNDYAEVDAVKGTLDFLQGRLELLIDVKNPASVDSNLISILEVNMGQFGFSEKNVEPISARSIRPVAVTIENMDPLALVISGGVSGSANIKLGSKSVHRQQVVFNLGTERRLALTQYFDALATKRTMNSGREAISDRMAKLMGILEEFTMEAIEENVLWKTETNKTIIATIQNVYNESKRAGRIDKNAQETYDVLGKALAAHVRDRNFRAGGGLRLSANPNKENFLKAIAQFANISTRLKDY